MNQAHLSSCQSELMSWDTASPQSNCCCFLFILSFQSFEFVSPFLPRSSIVPYFNWGAMLMQASMKDLFRRTENTYLISIKSTSCVCLKILKGSKPRSKLISEIKYSTANSQFMHSSWYYFAEISQIFTRHSIGSHITLHHLVYNVMPGIPSPYIHGTSHGTVKVTARKNLQSSITVFNLPVGVW